MNTAFLNGSRIRCLKNEGVENAQAAIFDI
jgi:hypothetical protein